MKCDLLHCAKVVIQLLLLVIFAVFFGHPAVERYLAKKVRIETTRSETGGIPAPAITLVVYSPETRNGWRTESRGDHDVFNLIQPQCGEASNIVKCIEDETFEETEAYKNVLLGFSSQTSLKNTSLVTVDFTSTFRGRSYTLDFNQKLDIDGAASQLFLSFESLNNYALYIHDKNYFLLNDNPYGLPSKVAKCRRPCTDHILANIFLNYLILNQFFGGEGKHTATTLHLNFFSPRIKTHFFS